MFKLFGRNMFVLPDKEFKKLLDVIPRNMNQEQTREYLKEFRWLELPGEDKYTDVYERPLLNPTNEFIITYGNNGTAALGKIIVAYNPKAGNVAFPHAKTLSKQIDKYLKKQGYEIKFLENEINYWEKDNTIVYKQIVNSKKYEGYPDIQIYIRNTIGRDFELIKDEILKERSKSSYN